MTHSRVTTACAFLLAAATMAAVMTKTVRADGLLFGYEGDAFPENAGFDIFNLCTGDCSRRLENGYFILEWGPMGDVVNYSHQFSSPSGGFPPPPPTLWVEWRYRSNQPIPPTSGSCDSRFSIKFRAASDIVFAFQNGVIDFEGGDFAIGLDPDIFHTYRFQSFDGFNYTFAVDGVVFNTDVDTIDTLIAFIQFGGEAGCGQFRPVPVRNEWDFIRYGTIETGEQIAAVDPPPGNIVTPQGEPLRSFTITFDQPAYLYVDDITASVTGGTAPTVVATRRLDNGPSEVLEVFIDGGLPFGQTTTFSFDTGTGPQTIAYTRVAPDIPASSTWGLIAFALGTLIAGAAIFPRRITS